MRIKGKMLKLTPVLLILCSQCCLSVTSQPAGVIYADDEITKQQKESGDLIFRRN